MAQFSFWLGNHSLMGQRSLEDVIGIFGHQLRALGHTAVWNAANDKFVTSDSGFNVVVEGFTPESVSAMAEGHASGARFVILATEEPTPKGFNHGTQKEMVARQEIFPQAARYADAIFHLVPGESVTRWYGQYAPTAHVELGYAPSLVRFDQTEPDFDFGFYGSLTKRRLTVLKKLAKAIGTEKAVKVVADFTTQMDRDREMRRAREIVQVRKFEQMGLVSSSRCNTALCLGRPVIAEPHLLSHPWDEVIPFTKTLDGFFQQAIMIRASWKGAHAAQFDKFKKKFPPELCAGRALALVGLLDRPARKIA